MRASVYAPCDGRDWWWLAYICPFCGLGHLGRSRTEDRIPGVRRTRVRSLGAHPGRTGVPRAGDRMTGRHAMTTATRPGDNGPLSPGAPWHPGLGCVICHHPLPARHRFYCSERCARAARRRNRRTSTGDYIKFARRILRALAERVADADIENLAAMAALSANVDELTAQAIAILRKKHGYSWTDIARELGVTRQGARQR